ncbi:MAG TPA: hybrid sensor histidine kinase/response regulator [Candidatus Thermoplasmatota archaeon]|nr:hybrid sensor histidine kinase/response regulator [Candidatus Thermoplasmatota archaeon]
MTQFAARATRVLVVEDNRGDLRFLEETLRETGEPFETSAASTLGEARKILAERTVDAVVTDLDLPDSRGLATVAGLLAERPQTPLVVLTGSDDPTLGVEAVRHGAQDYLRKDALLPDSLLRAIRYAIERKGAELERMARAEQEREVERLREMDRLKTQLVNLSAHELHTPLTPLRLQLHLLRTGKLGPLTARQQEAVEILDANVRRLGNLVSDMLDVARMESGRFPLRPATVDLGVRVAQAARPFVDLAAEEGKRLVVDAPEGLLVAADPERLDQIVANLLSNALKATRAGDRIEIHCARDGEAVLARVSDTGAGFPPEAQTQIFRPFEQAHEREGTGLGLYIARELAERHGGTLRAQSEGPGRGAVFELRLPAAAP